MVIGLLFKTKSLIGLIGIQINAATDQPFRKVKQVKGQDKKFHLLTKVNTLMIEQEHIFF